jgi:phage shock protein PspC (stress-responsive transcriptional regulator)
MIEETHARKGNIMTTDVKRLYRSGTDRMLGGVCGGVAEYFQVDSTLVRLAFIFLLFLGGSGIVLYLVGLIIMPGKPVTAGDTAAVAEKKTDGARIWGILLIALGSVFFLSNIGFPFWHDWWHVPWGVALPLILIGAGAWVLLSRKGSHVPAAPGPAVEPGSVPVNGTARLFRSRADSKLFGVCGGIGKYVSTDPTIVRILFIVAAFVSAGLMILLYLIMAIVVPQEPPASPQATQVPLTETQA